MIYLLKKFAIRLYRINVTPPLIPALLTLNVTVYNSLFYQLYCPSSHESRILKIGLIFL